MNYNEGAKAVLTITLVAIATVTVSSLCALADKYGVDKGEVIHLFAEGLLKQANSGEDVMESE